VTPEEIAALAAAAAQVKGKLAEAPLDSGTESAVASAPEAQAEGKAAEPQNIEAKAEERPLARAEAPVEQPKEGALEVATFAEQKSETQVEAPAEKFSDIPRVAAAVTTPSPANMIAAIAALEIGSGDGSKAPAAGEPPADLPATMAVAAGAEYLSVTSRWTAVSVALSADEASVSLEHEMQKAHAAFAAADAHAASATSVADAPVAAEQPAPAGTISPVEAVTPELVGPVQTISEPEPERTEAHLPSVSAMAGTAAEAITSAVKEFETVAASFFKSQPAPTEPEPAQVQAAEPVVAEAARLKRRKKKIKTKNRNTSTGKSGSPKNLIAKNRRRPLRQRSSRHKKPRQSSKRQTVIGMNPLRRSWSKPRAKLLPARFHQM